MVLHAYFMKNTKHLLRLTAALVLLLIFSNSAQAQNIPIIGLNDLETRLANGKDTTFVVNFWATWCGPCVKELPFFEKLGEARKDEKFEVLLVTLDFPNQLESKVKPFVKRKALKNEVLLMDEEKPNSWIPQVSEKWSGALPATIFVNTEKKTRHFHEGSFKEGELEQKLTKLGL